MEHESEGDINCNWRAWNGLQRLGELESGGEIEIEIDQNTEKSPRELRRLNVTQILGKDHQQTLMWKTLNNNSNNKLQA